MNWTQDAILAWSAVTGAWHTVFDGCGCPSCGALVVDPEPQLAAELLRRAVETHTCVGTDSAFAIGAAEKLALHLSEDSITLSVVSTLAKTAGRLRALDSTGHATALTLVRSGSDSADALAAESVLGS